MILTCIIDGEGTVITNNIPLKVTNGDIYISFPGDFHAISSSEKSPLRYDYIAFTATNPSFKKDLNAIMSHTDSYEMRLIRSSHIINALSNAIAEMSEKQNYNEEILSSLFTQIILYLLRSCQSGNKIPDRNNTSSSEELCFRIMHYIDTNMYSIQTLTILSEVFCYNYSYLSDIFKKTTGNTISNYYNSRRLEAACLLLSEGKLKISRIAEMLGYSSMYSFSKAFKMKYGNSPRNYNPALK